MALVERADTGVAPPARDGDVVPGEDFVSPDTGLGREMRDRRARRGLFALKRSPLARKIIMFNLIALNVLVAGILFVNASRQSVSLQRADLLASEAALAASSFAVQLPRAVPVSLAAGDGLDVGQTLAALPLRPGIAAYVFDPRASLLAMQPSADAGPDASPQPATPIVDALALVWAGVAQWVGSPQPGLPLDTQAQAQALVRAALGGQVQLDTTGPQLAAAAPIMQGQQAVGVLVLASAGHGIDALVKLERERVLRMFLIAIVVSVVLSLVLASTIANPISDLAEAAELGRDRDRRKNAGGRIRIPDLTARPDEIGRLSGALRGMVAALYDRIDGNEQFAADVAHELKNPLASLRSAVGSLRMVKRDEQRLRLLDVIEHDVRRLDRLVSDISNASRLDSELVKEEQEPFDLIRMLGNLGEYLGQQAGQQGIDFITDLPPNAIQIHGLEARLAQVFVNLITNAISFCEEGDAIRVWARQRENRILVVVEDTGPGIPEGALEKIFKRFYSERPEGQFGNNSGLGLAISKQIVEAHGGVIWAENIRPTDADISSEPLGARFVVGLPL